MDNVKRFGFVPDRVYGHDKFGVVGPLTEGTIYVEAKHFDASQASVVALQAENEALLKGLTGKNALIGATYAHLIEERDALRRHLHEATTSLETISKLAGRDEFMKHMSQVCGYANSRATVARAFMDQPGPVPSILDLSYEDAHKIDCELPAQHLPGGHTIGGQHFSAPAPAMGPYGVELPAQTWHQIFDHAKELGECTKDSSDVTFELSESDINELVSFAFAAVNPKQTEEAAGDE